MAFGDKTKKFQQERTAAEEAETPPEATPVEVRAVPMPDTRVTLSLSELRDLLGSAGTGVTPDLLREILTSTAQVSAQSMQKALRPENDTHPGISAYSYPEGDRARPRPTLPFELLWKGFPIHKEPEISAWWELEQYAGLKPGQYTCSKRDGGTIKVSVTATYAPDESVERLVVDFPCDREMRPMITPPYVMAYQMNHTGRPARETFVEAMTKLLTLQLADQQAKERPALVAV